MIRVALLVFGLCMLFLSGMVTFIRRDEVEPHYLEFTSLDSYSLISTCRLFYFHHPLECDFLDWEGRTIPSPDGRHRLVARDDGEPTVYTLYSSRKPLEFANHGAEPSWSPDGR
jgi:hypothetical protein